MGGERRPGTFGCVVRLAFVVLLGLFALVYAVGTVQEGITRYRIANGEGIRGTFTLERRVEESGFRSPSTWWWEGTFRSDGGAVREAVRIEPLPGDDGDAAAATGGWEVGDRVEARWTSATPRQAYLAETQTFRSWVESMVFLVVGGLLLVSVALLVRRYRRRHADDPPPTPSGSGHPAPSPPSEQEVAQGRIAQGDRELAVLRAELDRVRDERDGS